MRTPGSSGRSTAGGAGRGQCDHDLDSVNHAQSPTRSWTVTSVLYSSVGRQLASSSKHGTVRLWDSASGQPLRLLGRHKHAAFCLAFQPGSRWLACGGDDGDILIWDTSSSMIRSEDGIATLDRIVCLDLPVGRGITRTWPRRERGQEVRGWDRTRTWRGSGRAWN